MVMRVKGCGLHHTPGSFVVNPTSGWFDKLGIIAITERVGAASGFRRLWLNLTD
jgi:hypothetical protein